MYTNISHLLDTPAIFFQQKKVNVKEEHVDLKVQLTAWKLDINLWYTHAKLMVGERKNNVKEGKEIEENF